MPRVCTICRSPQRHAIDDAIVAGESSLRNIATQFGTSQSAVLRHKMKHLSPMLARAQEAREAGHEETLLDQVQALIKKGQEILNSAKDQKTALIAIREVRNTLELIAKLTGQFSLKTDVSGEIKVVRLPAKILDTDEWTKTYCPDN